MTSEVEVFTSSVTTSRWTVGGKCQGDEEMSPQDCRTSQEALTTVLAEAEASLNCRPIASLMPCQTMAVQCSLQGISSLANHCKRFQRQMSILPTNYKV